MVKARKPNRDPDVTLPSETFKDCTQIWVNENIFCIGKTHYMTSMHVSSANGLNKNFKDVIEYLEWTVKQKEFPRRAEAALTYLAEIQLLKD